MSVLPAQLLLLNSNDNVVIALGTVQPGPGSTADGENINVKQQVTLGHKIARHEIEQGTKILKYGVPIGSATERIEPGDHVHTHNMKSDYTPTHVLQETSQGTL